MGQMDAEWGEVVAAFVVPAEGAVPDKAVLVAFCRENIARYNRPKLYRKLAELPKDNYRKVPKTELRKMLEEEP